MSVVTPTRLSAPAPCIVGEGIADSAPPESWLAALCAEVVRVGLGVVFAMGVLAFGAVDPWATFGLQAGVAILTVVWAIGILTSRRATLTYSRLFPPIALFVVVVGIQLTFKRSAYWYNTWQAALLWCSYAMGVVLTTQLFRREVTMKRAGTFLALFAAAVSLFAIVQQFTSNGKIYWLYPNVGAGWFYGPYIYHANYAGLMEMLVPIPLVFAMGKCFPKPARGLFAFASVLIATTIFLAQSVGGILAFCAELIVLTLLISRTGRTRTAILWIGAVGIVLGLWLLILQPTELVQRFLTLRTMQGRADAGIRAAIAVDSVKMWMLRPYLGWGFGTFSTVYPSFRSFYTNLEINAAHNDLLQLIVETGAAGLVACTWFVVTLYQTSAAEIQNWRRSPRASLRLAALTGCSGLLVHSFC